MNTTNEFDSFTNNAIESDKQLLEMNQKITIKFKARNARKGLTTIYGLKTFKFDDDQLATIAKNIKKKFSCASYVKVIEGETVIEVQGNKVDDVSKLLENEYKISNKKLNY